ncbi:hypothetical protein FNV43_RR04997 [Rhamnella rubrinervis]|uniref:Pectinesterase inhibitor domain-containing protein n=1 Tax=Rhamnella rubrinervis TaxID=2594499 RepID=A0A8K0MQN4_9ROSA|nr:hypothetical protein FNV43_RR04997 [Rhamnella rubrinervis]
MKPTSSVYVLILVPLLFSHLHESNAKGQINNACGGSLYKDLCISTLKKDASYKGANLCDLAKIALKAATDNATAIQKQISQMQMSESHTDLKKSLADCKENYESAVSQLQKSEEALLSKRYNDVNAWVTAAMSDLESCGDGFEEEGLKASPILNMNTILSHLCSNVLAITNKLSESGSTPSPSPSPPTSASSSSSTSSPTSASSSSSTSPPTSASTPTSGSTSSSTPTPTPSSRSTSSSTTTPSSMSTSSSTPSSRSSYKEPVGKVESAFRGDIGETKLFELAKTALKAFITNATAIHKQVSEIQMPDSHTDLKKSLADCKENYKNAFSQLQKCNEALESKRYTDVKTWVSAAMSDIESCGDGFKEEGLKASPLLNLNNIFKQQCSNVLAIVNKLCASGSVSAGSTTAKLTPHPAADQGAKAGSANKWATLCDQAKTGIKAITESAMAIQKEVSGLLVESSQSGLNIKKNLKDCKENYQNAVFQLKKCQDALEAKRYNDVNQWVSAAMTDAQSCAESFAAEDAKSPICEKSKVFKQQCSNILAVTNQLAASQTSA